MKTMPARPRTRAAALLPQVALPAAQPVLLVAGIAAACALRSAAGGSSPAASYPAAIVFAGALLALWLAPGVRRTPEHHRGRAMLLGFGGAALLVAAWATGTPHIPMTAGRHLPALLVWTPIVALVATAEELVLRGALFRTLLDSSGAPVALAVTTIVFGLMHVPLYGWGALPLDLAAGLLLGGLRLLSGGVTAPIVAHGLADLAGGWLG